MRASALRCRTCLPAGRISLCVTPYVAKEKTFQVTRLSTPVGMNFPESQHYMYDYVESMPRIFPVNLMNMSRIVFDEPLIRPKPQ